MNWKSIATVAWWEFIQKVKTKAFILSMILSPVIMGVFSVLPILLTSVSVEEPKKILILDKQQSIGRLAKPMVDSITYSGGEKKFDVTVKAIDPKQQLNIATYQQALLREEYVGMIVIPSNVYSSKKMDYHSQHVGNARELEEITEIFDAIIQDSLLTFYGMKKTAFKDINKGINLSTIKVQKDGSSESGSFLVEFASVYGTIFIILLMVSFSGQQLVRSLLDEKTNRIIEILLSSVTPMELMTGKLLGLGGLGLIQASFWLIFAWLGATFSQVEVSVFASIHLIFLYAMLGYFLFASIMIGLGSLATTEQEAQTMTGYIMMLATVPFILMFVIIENPGGTISKVCSYIPFLTPAVMSARIAILMPHWSEIVLSVLVLIASIFGCLWISAKLFTVGMLTYGKRISFSQARTIIINKSEV
ncbi:MAG: ABC transporter permease [Ignavibacteria bacterium]|nr:ABC transporter permease [Ignavibacteria bacterium]